MLQGCQSIEKFASDLVSQSPREAYAASLRTAGLQYTQLGRQWTQAAETAKLAAVELTDARYQESGYFSPGEVRASSFRIHLQRGEQLQVQVSVTSEQTSQLFADVYVAAETGWAHRESITPGNNPVHINSQQDADYLILLQPELLAPMRYELALAKGGSLTFPVQGKTSRAIGGVFGDPRDGGRRKHHGVDIFAKRGTPVVAVTSGSVRTGESKLGGQVVWLRDAERGVSYYYAHLDKITVSNGARVTANTPLGEVGNSGNARGTPPHLHFGIYANLGGPENPQPYIQAAAKIPKGASQPPAAGSLRVASAKLRLRKGPNTDASILGDLPRGTLIHAVATHGTWYRVTLADGRRGYVGARWLEPIQTALQKITINKTARLLASPHADALELTQISDTRVSAFARMGDYWWVEDNVGRRAWLAPG